MFSSTKILGGGGIKKSAYRHFFAALIQSYFGTPCLKAHLSLEKLVKDGGTIYNEKRSYIPIWFCGSLQ